MFEGCGCSSSSKSCLGVPPCSQMLHHVPRCCTMFPDAAPCPGDQRPLQYYTVADDAFLLQENLMKPFYHKDMIPSELNLQLQNIAGPKSHGECIWHHEQPIFFSKEDHTRTIEGNKDCACDMHTAQYATERDFKYFFRLMLTSQNSWRLQQL